MKKVSEGFLVFLFVLSACHIRANDTTIKVRPATRKLCVATAQGLAYAGTFTFLNEAWYKHYERSSFHRFDDSGEWMQMDKVGHAYSTYWGAMYFYVANNWAGYGRGTSLTLSALEAWACVSTIEIFDGFSRHWGASPTDLLANTAGSLMFAGQEFFLGEQVALLKFSYWPSVYADRRPDELGATFQQRIIKDYNAQVFWLSVNARKTTSLGFVPRWLNVAVGYGAKGLVEGRETNFSRELGVNRSRRYFLSLDVDMRQIRTRSKVLRTFFFVASMLKFPFPCLEYGAGQVKITVR